MAQQDLKSHIRSWLKNHQKVDSDLGEIIIGKPLGEGGNALVFDSPSFNGIAIKFLAESVSFPLSTRYARFLDEYRNLIKLVPTGVIVPLYQFGIQDMDGEHIPYILMERCVQTLYDKFKSSKLVDVEEFDKLLFRLLDILEVVHNEGIVHRDIKPQNILLRPNGHWVLGDFGISWFDPEMHTKLAVTKTNARLANFEFSAPEQVNRKAYDSPTPSMDLFALGQTLYYCVTGSSIRGSKPPGLRRISPALSNYDPLIEKLIRQIPEERFQSVSDVRHFLKEQQADTVTKQMTEFYAQVGAFDLALRSSIPGTFMGYVQAKNKEEINRALSSLAKHLKACDLWWYEDNQAENKAIPIKKLLEDIWLIDSHECNIVDLWIYRHYIEARQYVIIHLAPRPKFGIYDYGSDDEDDTIEEEAAYFRGKYVTRGEFDDGYAMIEGKVVELRGAEIRTRNLKDTFLVLAPRLSVYHHHHAKYNQQIREVYNALLAAGKITPSLLAPLENLIRPRWMTAWD